MTQVGGTSETNPVAAAAHAMPGSIEETKPKVMNTRTTPYTSDALPPQAPHAPTRSWNGHSTQRSTATESSTQSEPPPSAEILAEPAQGTKESTKDKTNSRRPAVSTQTQRATPTRTVPRVIQKHFDVDSYRIDEGNGIEAVCKYCKTPIKGQKNVTSNFLQHVRRKHPQYEDASHSRRPSKKPRAARTEHPPLPTGIANPAPRATYAQGPSSSSSSLGVPVPSQPLVASRRSHGLPEPVRSAPFSRKFPNLSSPVEPATTVAGPQTGLHHSAGELGTRHASSPSNHSSWASPHGPDRAGTSRDAITDPRPDLPYASVPIHSDPPVRSFAPTLSRSDVLHSALTASTYAGAMQTKCEPSQIRSMDRTAQILLKREDLQISGSIHYRAAYTMLHHSGRGDAGLCAGMPSALAVAKAAQKLRLPCNVILPMNSSDMLRDAIRSETVQVSYDGSTDEMSTRCARQTANRSGLWHIDVSSPAFVPFKGQADAIAGYATLALEIARQASQARYVYVAGGCALLFASLASVFNQLMPGVRLVGVVLVEDSSADHEDVSGRHDSASPSFGLDAGRESQPDHDGVGRVLTWRSYANEIVRVTNAEAYEAVRRVYETCDGSLLTRSGALSVAGALKNGRHVANGVFGARRAEGDVVCVVSEKQHDFDEISKLATSPTSDCGLGAQPTPSATVRPMLPPSLGLQHSDSNSTGRADGHVDDVERRNNDATATVVVSREGWTGPRLGDLVGLLDHHDAGLCSVQVSRGDASVAVSVRSPPYRIVDVLRDAGYSILRVDAQQRGRVAQTSGMGCR